MTGTFPTSPAQVVAPLVSVSMPHPLAIVLSGYTGELQPQPPTTGQLWPRPV